MCTMDVPNLLGSLIGRLCVHEFLWPHRDSGGSYHQACARCGKHFTFDWRAMTRSEKIAQRVSPIAQRVGTLVPRAHRVTARKPIFYRPTGGPQFKLGVLLDISKSGVLLECQSQIIRGQELEMLFEMPQEITGQANRTVLSNGVVARIASTNIGSPLIGVRLSGYHFLSK
jgi:hypothetical protein